MENILNDNKKFISVFLIIISVFFAVRILSELMSLESIRRMDASTITLTGHGEVDAAPDIASIYFTVESSKSTQLSASDEVNTKTKKVLDFLKSAGIAEKDIKTEGYNSYPKYSNPEPCPLYYPIDGIMPPCRSEESKIIGYSVSQNVSVKIRQVDDAGKIVDGINKIGVTNMSGPNFAIDDEEKLKLEARRKAIKDAKEKAKILADDLGMRLGKVVSFQESGGYYPMMYEAKDMAVGSPAPSRPANLPKGEQTISSDVTVVYELR